MDLNSYEPRLIDFGMSARTGESFFGGTPITMSPEVAKKKAPEPASDIYALGCIMYQQITGDNASVIRPGPGSLSGYVVANKTDFKAPEWQQPPLNECRAFIEACMRTDPAQRPTTAQILQAVRGEPIVPAKPGEPGLTAKDLGALEVLKPEKGHALQAKELLSQL